MDKKTVEHLEHLIDENTSLRALLVEAREIARSVRNAGSLPYAQWSRDQHDADSVVDRIDTALAEPTHNKGKA